MPPPLVDTIPVNATERQPRLEEPMSHSLITPREVLNTTEPAQVAPSSSGNCSLRTILAAGKTQKTLQWKEQFADRLNNCKNLEDIHQLSVSLNLDLSSNSLCSKLAFKHLLGTQCGLDTFTKFLEDSSLNAPEARNLDALLQWHVKYSRRDKDKILPNWITQRVSQGNGEELSSLLETISSLTGEIEFGDGSCSFSQIIFNGLSSSTIFTFHDVNGTLLMVLLQSLTSGSLSPEKRSLGVEIITRSSPSQLQALGPGISSFLKSCLEPQNWQHETQLFDPEPVSKILKFLVTAPIKLKTKYIRDATQALLVHSKQPPNNLSALLENLKQWWNLLIAYGMFTYPSQSVEWERKMARQDVRILASYLRKFGRKQICYFLLRNWFAPEIGIQATRRLGKPLPIEKEFEANLIMPQKEVSPFVVMVQSLGPELPSNSKWIMSLFSLLREIGESLVILKIVIHRQKLGLPVSLAAVINEINEQSTKSPAIAFGLFKVTPNLSLETCPSVAKIMINNSRFNPSTALSFRYARQQSLAPHKRYFREPFDILGEWGRGNYPTREPESIKQSRAFLLETMAIAYAEAPHLFGNVAWMHVLRCFKFHRFHRLGPVGLDMSRALVISKVVRRLQENKWVSPVHIRWILGIVWEAEGEEVMSGLDKVMYDWREKVVERNIGLKEMKRRWWKMGIEGDKPCKTYRPRDIARSEWTQVGNWTRWWNAREPRPVIRY